MSESGVSDFEDGAALFGGEELAEDVARQQGASGGEEGDTDGESDDDERYVRREASGSAGEFGGYEARAGIATSRASQMEALARRFEAVAQRAPGGGARHDMRAAMGAGVGGSGAAGAGLRMGGNGHDDARPEDDERSLGSGAQADLTFDGFDDRMFKVEGEPVPLLRSSGELWTALSGNLGPLEMRPKRAMRLGIISPFFRRDAEFFKQWQLPKGHESRAQATAALVSLLFAGTAMGLVSGKHEEKTRSQHQEAADQADAAAGGAGKKKATPQLSHVSRYTYIPAADEQDSHPMFQIGLEELYNEEQTEVLALAVWLFVSARHSSLDMLATHPPLALNRTCSSLAGLRRVPLDVAPRVAGDEGHARAARERARRRAAVEPALQERGRRDGPPRQVGLRLWRPGGQL